MDVSVGIFQGTSTNTPHVGLQSDGNVLSIPWPVWETLVHRASHLYVTWALNHPDEYAALQDAVDHGLYAELRTAGHAVSID